ncbi:MAG: amylo-alpha-1,6-glucosidase [Candidatus Dormibacteraeota bacterium]|nr:amylo-alpha-1,6-glucosidase [Candidatus Dormibacteraeota bacterium]
MLQDRVILKENRVFAVSDASGDMPVGNDYGFGLYHLDTRFLSGFQLRVNGCTPILLSSSVDRAYVATFQLVNPALPGADGTGADIPRQTLSIRRTRFMHRGLHERIGIQNCNRRAVDVTLELDFTADFRDIFAVRGYHARDATGTVRPVELTDCGFRFRYDGKDDVPRCTEVVFHSNLEEPELTGSAARFPLHLGPQETFVLQVDILPLVDADEPPLHFDFDSALADLETSYRHWNQTCTQIRSDNEVLDGGVLWRSREDIRILCDDFATGLFPTAGIPWYAVPFGRDGLITSIQTLGLNPDLARGTLRYLSRFQGTKVDESREEEPGKIFHEIRFGELANLHLIPHTPYYGSVDSTPLFLCLLVDLIDWTADVDLLTELTPNVLAALAWCDKYGDRDGDGFVEYQQHNPVGVRNQGWKDSVDSLTAVDGSLAPLPAALVEVQGYVYRAKSGLARIFRSLGQRDTARRLDAEARLLRQRFNAAYWMPERRFYAQALDGDKAKVEAISSNPGHALWSGVIERSRATDVVRRLMSPEMFSGWGIRTLSSEAASYNPMSYHNGSVWPHDNSIVAAGMKRYGFDQEAEIVARSIIEAGMRFADARLPELFCGFTRDRKFNSQPGEYLVSCNPQAWGSGAVFHLLTVLLGLEVDMLNRRVRINPIETPLYGRLHVSGLRVGDGTLDFTVDRRRGGVRVMVDRCPNGVIAEHNS